MSTETLEQRTERIRRQAMRDHPFEPMQRDARYCGHMGAPATSGSAETGHVSVSAECGYPPDLHPPRPPAIGHGPHESAVTHVARKRHRCQESVCSTVIQPGQMYVRATTFPSHDIMTGQLLTWKFCVGCATRYGRPLPPRSARASTVDLEAVQIAVRGERQIKLNRPERRAAVTLLSDKGLNVPQIAQRVGLTTRSVQRMRARLGLSGGTS